MADYLLIAALALSLAGNTLAFVRVKRCRANLRYMRLEYEHFVADTGQRVQLHERQIGEIRAELQSLEPAARGDACTSPAVADGLTATIPAGQS